MSFCLEEKTITNKSNLKMKNLEMKSWIPGLNLKKIVENLEKAISWFTLKSPISIEHGFD